MATADRYSRLVLWLKVALPLAALAILSTLFFVAETLDPDAAIPYAKVDVERMLREQGVTAPAFGGVTADGVAIALSAASIRPDGEDQENLKGTELVATLDLPSGGHVSIESPQGSVDTTRQQAILSGGARLESSTGYVVETDRIVASLAEARVYSETEISARGPAGELTAGQMELTRSGKSGSGYLLVFKGGVRLVYRPEQ